MQDYPVWNVASQLEDPESIMAYWKKMIALRKEYPDLFVYGSYTPLSESDIGEMVIGYERHSQETDQSMVVLLNFSDQVSRLSSTKYQSYSVVVFNQSSSDHLDDQIEMRPFGSLVLLKE